MSVAHCINLTFSRRANALEWAAASNRTDLDTVRAGVEGAESKIQTHPDSAAHPEGSVHRLSEVCTEGVKVYHAVGHAVEGQRPCGQVQVDAQAGGVCDRYVPLLIVMHCRAACVRQLQGPGLGVVTKPRPGVRAFPGQRAVGYAHG